MNYEKKGFDPYKPFLKSVYPPSAEKKNIVPPIQFYRESPRIHSESVKPEVHHSKKVYKYRYHSPDGKKLAAGGILLFEETTEGKGLWLVEEEENGCRIYTDFGGKYDHNDGDIKATISREFREECYNTCEITYKEMENIAEENYYYINGYDNLPSYVCVVVHINNFSNIKFSSEKVRSERERVIKSNPHVPADWYKTLDVKFVLLKDIYSKKRIISSRLNALLDEIKTRKNPQQEIKNFFII